MASGFLLSAVVWSLASATAIALLGALSLRGGRARPRGALAFGLFAVAWGAQIAVGNLAALWPGRASVLLFLAFATFSVASTYFLVEFAASQAPGRDRSWRSARLAAAGWGFLCALLVVFAPGLLAVESTGVAAQGPLFTTLLVLPQFAAFGLALVALDQARRIAPTPRTALRADILLAGLGLYVAYIAGYQSSHYVGAAFLFPVATNAPLVLAFPALAILVIVLARGAHARTLAARTPVERSRARLLTLALVAPLAWGLVEGGLSVTLAPYLLTVGLWRILAIAVVAYGLARWRLFDLPQRTARAAAATGGTAAALAGGAAAYGAGSLVTTGPVLPALAALVVLGVTIRPGILFARRVLLRAVPGPLLNENETDEQLYGQRLDSYRAALEASIARGSLDEDETFLAALRERFRIDPSEHRVLLHYAQSSVLLARAEDDANAGGSYERLRLLGEGGSGRTWLARDRVRERLVVLKEPLERWQREPQLHETVLREARLAARVRHANVISVEEVVVDHRGMPILVMEHAEGGSLADLLRRRGTLPWREAVTLELAILRGVEAIHASGIVHRDLKPSNVLLALDGTPKVSDFGIAIPARPGGRTIVDGSTTFAGTLSYVAPEVRDGRTPGDRRSDVYACAAILHEMLCGAPPGSPRGPLEHVPAPLDALLARALSRDADQRVATARELAEGLTSLVKV